MRKKSRSSSDLQTSEGSRIKSRNLHPLISPPNFDENSQVVNETLHLPAHHQNFSLQTKEFFRIRESRSKNSFIIKKKQELTAGEDKKKQGKGEVFIESMEKCREIFEQIIEEDKKNGAVLRQIKEMYEKEIAKKINPEVAINLKAKVVRKVVDKEKTRLKHSSSGNLALNMTLGRNKPLKISPLLMKKDSLSTLDTIVNSHRSDIPELNLIALPQADFHQEFMANYDNFSESWRKLTKDLKK